MRYDTIIIGAGLSGLAAGIRLAYYDKKVVVLERHTTIGGLNSFYRLRGRNYDVGLHAVTNYAPPGTRGGPLAKILKQLRLRWDDFDLSPQIGSSCVFPGHELRFANGLDELRSEVERAFPSQRDGFAALLRRIDEHPLLPDDRPPTAREVLAEHLSDPVLVDMLLCPVLFYGGARPADTSFAHFSILFRAIFEEGLGRPRGGVRPILKALVRRFREQGGELRLRAGVRAIRHESGRCTGVTLDDGTELEATNVLSSAGAHETAALCGDGSEQRDENRHGDVSFVEAIFHLDRPPAELGIDRTIVFFNDHDRFEYGRPEEPCDLRSGMVCTPNNFHYESPLDEEVVRVSALANPAAWMELPEAEYVRAKAEWCQRIVDSAVRFVPEFRSHVVETDVFTPRTIRRFTGHPNGTIYGAPGKHVDGRTHLEHLYLCGNDQGLLGVVGAMLSGITMANAHLLR